MQNKARVLTPDVLHMLDVIAETGSFAAAARALGLVPSALTYRVRQVEDALDVLLFDRKSRQAKPTDSGRELLREGKRLLNEMDAVANRVRRIATGWEAALTIAVDTIIARDAIMDLCDAFLAMAPPTRLRILDEAISGTVDALNKGLADLAIGIPEEAILVGRSIHHERLGELRFVYVVAPHHPLARVDRTLSPDELMQHRTISVGDSIGVGAGVTIGLMPGQDVLTLPSMQAKLEAQIRGLGGGFVPEAMARPYIDTGRLVVKSVAQPERKTIVRYAWRNQAQGPGRALAWWLAQLKLPQTRDALTQHLRPHV